MAATGFLLQAGATDQFFSGARSAPCGLFCLGASQAEPVLELSGDATSNGRPCPPRAFRIVAVLVATLSGAHSGPMTCPLFSPPSKPSRPSDSVWARADFASPVAKRRQPSFRTVPSCPGRPARMEEALPFGVRTLLEPGRIQTTAPLSRFGRVVAKLQQLAGVVAFLKKVVASIHGPAIFLPAEQ